MNFTKPSGRIYGLDIMRAAAIILVMISHGSLYSDKLFHSKHIYWLLLDGVSLFFVLSGFLIGRILINTVIQKELSIKDLFNFWTRRWFRTLPNYYLVLGLVALFYYYRHQQMPPSFFQYITFTQCFAQPHPIFFIEAWSLAVEEWFYLLIPAGLFVIVRFTDNRKASLLTWILFIISIGTILRGLKASERDYFETGDFASEVGRLVITRLDTIMYGVLGAWFAYFKPKSWLRYANACLLIGLAILFTSQYLRYAWPLFHRYYFYSLTALGALCLLPKLSDLKSGQGKVFSVITFISIISYSMYLTNQMLVMRGVLLQLNNIFRFNFDTSMSGNAIMYLLFWTFTILLSYLLYRFWEQPMLKLRERIRGDGT